MIFSTKYRVNFYTVLIRWLKIYGLNCNSSIKYAKPNKGKRGCMSNYLKKLNNSVTTILKTSTNHFPLAINASERSISI